MNKTSEGPNNHRRSKRQWQAVAEDRFKKSVSPQELLHDIVSDGYSTNEAEDILQGAFRKAKQHAGKMIGCSAILFLAGLVLTILTMEGEFGVIWCGAILCGLVGIIYGLFRLLRILRYNL